MAHEEVQEGELDITVDDVTRATGKNIFQLISTRYFKTAYPVLLEEIK